MDEILRGILVSSHPENVKKLLLLKIRDSCTSNADKKLASRILEVCLCYIQDELSFNSAMAKEIFEKWTLVNLEEGLRWLQKLVETLEENQEPMPFPRSHGLYLLQYVLSVVKEALTAPAKTKLEMMDVVDQILDQIARHWIKSEDVEVLARLSWIMTENWECFDTIVTRSSMLMDICEKCLITLNSFKITEVVAESFSSPRRLGSENSLLEANQDCFRQARDIAALLGSILATHQDHMEFVLNKAFSLLASETELPGLCLAAILNHLPALVIENAMHTVSQDSRIKDQNLFLVLNRIINWLAWPFSIPIDVWVVQLMKALFNSDRAQLVFKTMELQALEVSKHLFTTGSQQETLTILSNMLLRYQKSPDVFHRVLNRLVLFIQCVQLEDSTKAQEMLSVASDLLHTMIYQFPGHDKKYSEALEVLKLFPRPPESKMKQWLRESSSWQLTEEQDEVQFPDKLPSQRTGLRNLGNTCYINSVIQALFMLRSFQQEVLQRKWVLQTQPLSSILQKLFSALLATKRLAINPRDFVSISRPPWFTKGSQQDCSEFLKYMLDRLEDEDRNSPPVLSPLHKQFSGECMIQTQCFLCQTTTSRIEAFNDLPLSFPAPEHLLLETAPSDEPPSLKGGELLRTQGSAYHSQESDREGEAGSSQDSWMSGPQEFDRVTSTRPSPSPNTTSTESAIHLEDLLANALSPEVLTGVNQYKCDACGCLRDAERQLYLTKLPTYLVLTLKRFTYDAKLGSRTKIMTRVQYPVSLTVPQTLTAELGSSSPEATCTNFAPIIRGPANLLMPTENGKADKSNGKTDTDSRAGGSQTAGESRNLDPFLPNNFSSAQPPEKAELLVENPCLKSVNDAGNRKDKQICRPFYTLPHSRAPQKEAIKIRNVEYMLRAVIVHSGTSSDSGHYYSLCREDTDSGNGSNLNAKRKCTDETQTHTITSDQGQSSSSSLAGGSNHLLPQSDKLGSDDVRKCDNPCKTASVRKRLSNDDASAHSRWTLFNDSVATPMDFASFSLLSTRQPNDTPYVLIYEEATNERADFPSYVGSRDDLQTELQAMLEADDQLYAQELGALRKRGKGKMWAGSKASRKDDDDDQGPSAGCGGSLGHSHDLNGGRFIF